MTRCLASDPADRFQTTTELCAALARFDDTGEVIPEPRRLTKPMLAFGVAFMILLAVGTYFATRRGVEHLGSMWTLLDLTPYDRQETWEDSPSGWPQTPPYAWWRRHDEYAV